MAYNPYKIIGKRTLKHEEYEIITVIKNEESVLTYHYLVIWKKIRLLEEYDEDWDKIANSDGPDYTVDIRDLSAYKREDATKYRYEPAKYVVPVIADAVKKGKIIPIERATDRGGVINLVEKQHNGRAYIIFGLPKLFNCYMVVYKDIIDYMDVHDFVQYVQTTMPKELILDLAVNVKFLPDYDKVNRTTDLSIIDLKTDNIKISMIEDAVKNDVITPVDKDELMTGKRNRGKGEIVLEEF